MRVDALDKPGGDVLHMQTYIRNCQVISAQEGIAFDGVITTDLEPDFRGFDLVHLTNIDRPVELYSQFDAGRRFGMPMILSPLHHSYEEIRRYEWKGRGGSIGCFSGLLGFQRLELLRSLVRARDYPQLSLALKRVVGLGIRRAQAEILSHVNLVLVAADKELSDIEREIAPLDKNRTLCVRNGFQMPSERVRTPSERDINICVAGRIEARKNQIAILEALDFLNLSAIFIGPENSNHKRYCARFRAMIAASKSSYLGARSQNEVYEIMARSRVHVAASWFEVSSNVDIEAYVLGCRTVASLCGGTIELLGRDAYYVDPASVDSIGEQILAALSSSQMGFENIQEYKSGLLDTWEVASRRVLAAYYDILGRNAI